MGTWYGLAVNLVWHDRYPHNRKHLSWDVYSHIILSTDYYTLLKYVSFQTTERTSPSHPSSWCSSPCIRLSENTRKLKQTVHYNCQLHNEQGRRRMLPSRGILFYECSLQQSMLIYAYFSLNKLHSCYNKQLTFISSEVFMGKVHGNLIFYLWIFTLLTVFM
jgi:hypothetical protein